MKLAEIRELNQDELNAQILGAQKELFEARFKHSMHQLDDTDALRRLRHRIAQCKTVLAEKSGKVQLKVVAPAAKPAKAAKAAKVEEPVAEAAVSTEEAVTEAPKKASKSKAAGGEKKSTGTAKKTEQADS